MPKLLFEPAVSKIGENEYFITTKNDTDKGRVAIYTDEVGKFIITSMWPEHRHKADIITDLCTMYPEEDAAEIEQVVINTIATLRSYNSGGGEANA